jgi:hypothetical protein
VRARAQVLRLTAHHSDRLAGLSHHKRWMEGVVRDFHQPRDVLKHSQPLANLKLEKINGQL